MDNYGVTRGPQFKKSLNNILISFHEGCQCAQMPAAAVDHHQMSGKSSALLLVNDQQSTNKQEMQNKCKKQTNKQTLKK